MVEQVFHLVKDRLARLALYEVRAEVLILLQLLRADVVAVQPLAQEVIDVSKRHRGVGAGARGSVSLEAVDREGAQRRVPVDAVARLLLQLGSGSAGRCSR